MANETDKRTATQKIEDLEKVVTMLYQTTAQIKGAVENLLKSQGDMGLVKEALKLLNKKLDAVIQTATAETGITADSVNTLVIKMNVEDLKAQVAGYVASGHLVPAETTAKDSYLVCEEYNADGTLANPRIQFRLDSQDEATVATLTGKSAGDTVNFGENKFSAKILEIYTVVDKAPDAPAAEAPAASTDAPAATPAAETPTAPASAAAPIVPGAPLPELPAETPVAQFVSDNGSTAATA